MHLKFSTGLFPSTERQLFDQQHFKLHFSTAELVHKHQDFENWFVSSLECRVARAKILLLACIGPKKHFGSNCLESQANTTGKTSSKNKKKPELWQLPLLRLVEQVIRTARKGPCPECILRSQWWNAVMSRDKALWGGILANMGYPKGTRN